MRKKSATLWVLVLVLTAACGKNGPFDGGYVPPTPIAQAPAYPAYPSGYNGNQLPGCNVCPLFTPQMPQGYPAAYTPFLPIDYYMRNNPSTAAYWPGFWSQWTGYCNRTGYSPYNFNHFWSSYVPQHWNTGASQQLYNYFNSTFYSWVSPNVTYAQTLNPSTFWSNYRGTAYGPAWGYY